MECQAMIGSKSEAISVGNLETSTAYCCEALPSSG